MRKRVTFETAGAWLIGGSPSAVRWALGLLVGVIALVGTAIFAFYVGIYFLLWCVTVIPACLLLLLVGKTVVSPFKAVQVIKSRRHKSREQAEEQTEVQAERSSESRYRDAVERGLQARLASNAVGHDREEPNVVEGDAADRLRQAFPGVDLVEEDDHREDDDLPVTEPDTEDKDGPIPF